MRIAQVATNVESVPPEGYGGTELVVHLLTEELVRRGHEVTLFATANSVTSARLVPTVAQPLRTDPNSKPTQWAAYDMQTCLKLTERQHEFDIVHSHLGYHAFPFLDKIDPAVVSTNHNPVKNYCKDIYLAFKHLPFVSISDAYRALNYPKDLNYVATVYNGIDTSKFKSAPEKERNYLLFIGRLGYDKGTAEAIDIAKALDLPLKLAGKIDDADRAYFDSQIKPKLDAFPKAEYVGEVNSDQKRDLYSRALAVVYPINFDEPFGLVMVEALASGTPVLALKRGSVAEILVDKKTAVIGSNVTELIARYPEISRIKSADCIEQVNRLFTVKHMVDGYEAVYKQLIEKRKGGSLIGSPIGVLLA